MDRQIHKHDGVVSIFNFKPTNFYDGIGSDHNDIRMDKQVKNSDNSFEKAIKSINHLKNFKNL